jgi:hypothetical protein
MRKTAAPIGLMAALFLGSVAPAFCVSPTRLAGSLGGQVLDSSGVAQMGATVVLYNRYDRAIREALTDQNGSFVFDSLLPGVYSISVRLAAFVPAFKRNIAVQPGFHSVLTINLSSILSSIEFVSTMPTKGSLMTEQWKWVLRSAKSTKPVLRFQDVDLTNREKRSGFGPVFSETRGIVKVSAGEPLSLAGSGSQPDLGTAFALATSFLGSNQLQVSGNFGYAAHSGMPVAGFRSTFSRTSGAMRTPEVTVTMRQLYLPARGGLGVASSPDGPSALRTMSVSFLDELAVMDFLHVEYGMSAESVSFMDRLNMLSPFARVTTDLGRAGSVQVAYSSGAAPVELATRAARNPERDDSVLHSDLAALAIGPRISMRDGHAKIQRTESAELGYRKVAGSRTFAAAVYHERVTDGALTMAGPEELYPSDAVPDLNSDTAIFNIGRFQRWGYAASLTQNLGEKIEVSVAYGRGGALTATRRNLQTADPNELRSIVKMADKAWATARVSGTAPLTGTKFAASYGWADYRSLMPAHFFLTQRMTAQPGLHISVRQPLPSFSGMPGRFEATADLQNLLEQGYLPLFTSDGRSVVLTNAPRSVRGGVSFIF